VTFDSAQSTRRKELRRRRLIVTAERATASAARFRKEIPRARERRGIRTDPGHSITFNPREIRPSENSTKIGAFSDETSDAKWNPGPSLIIGKRQLPAHHPREPTLRE
jgi:hypothetical protein